MKIAFISCVKSKRKGSWRAMDLYISDLFKKSFRYCSSNYDMVYILSAKYGLLDPYTMIEDYDVTLNKMNKTQKDEWYDRAASDIKTHVNKYDELYFYCGVNYRKGLIERLNNDCYEPLKGVSFGNQLKFYKNQINPQLCIGI